MNVSQVCIGRFHHFHLARELEKRGLLQAIFSAYPKFKLKDEFGIPARKIRTFPWIYTPFMARGRLGLTGDKLSADWGWLAAETLDWHASRNLAGTDVLIALSGSGLRSGKAIKRRGGAYICDRASTHIRFQEEILREEYARWKVDFPGVDSRFIAKDEAEYELADRVTVPSGFVYRSFLAKGMDPAKVVQIPYGARLDRFRPVGEPPRDAFHVLFVGQVAIRKGFLNLLEAFARFRHPSKRLTVIGSVLPEIEGVLHKYDLAGVEFLGIVANAELASSYSRSHVLVLPSVEEGMSYVQGEALACGCPVIATPNTGAEDLFSDGVEGFIVPIRDSGAILERLERLAQEPALQERMRSNALERVKLIGGWDEYGKRIAELLSEVGRDGATA